MIKTKFKKALWISLSTILLLGTVLVVHIYLVTRQKAPETTKIMARLDFKQNIVQADADKITAWLYSQKGVDHVLLNQESDRAVFTFYPVKTNPDKILNGLRSELHYQVDRYMPSKEELQSGCPVAAGSLTSKVYNSFANLFN